MARELQHVVKGIRIVVGALTVVIEFNFSSQDLFPIVQNQIR